MIDTDQIQTVAVKLCAACGGGLLERDRFCRWCGVCQQIDGPALEEDNFKRALTAPGNNGSTSPYTTSSLEQAGPRNSFYRPVSGPLVSAMLAGATTRHARPLYSRILRKTIFALISVPIWLMIVLLSPIDAYAAARDISNEY